MTATAWPERQHDDGITTAHLKWMFDAPCGNDPDLWFSDDPDAIATAKEICLTVCPFGRRIACMDYAIDNREEYGVWGGVGRDERVTKRCGSCEQVKTISEFGANAAKPDGLNQYCRQCTNAAKRARADKPREDDARARAAKVASLRSAQLRAAAVDERMALYARLWWDQKMPRSAVMQQLGIKSRSTAQEYEAKIREQQGAAA